MLNMHRTARSCSSGPGARGEKKHSQRLKNYCTIGEKYRAGKATSSRFICFRKDLSSEHLINHYTKWKIYLACRDSQDRYLKDQLPLFKTSVKPSNTFLRFRYLPSLSFFLLFTPLLPGRTATHKKQLFAAIRNNRDKHKRGQLNISRQFLHQSDLSFSVCCDFPEIGTAHMAAPSGG